jgi:hypothetical protein
MLWYIKIPAHGKFSAGASGTKATKRGTVKCFAIHVKSYAYFSSSLQTFWLMEKNNQVEYTREKAWRVGFSFPGKDHISIQGVRYSEYTLFINSV